MAQLFRPSANSAAKFSLILAAGAPWLIIYAGSTISRSPANTKVDIALDQPVPFSHQHHAWELGIDCRYCHGAVEKSANAGVPPTETCMTCHSQIWTNSPLLEPVRKSYETGMPIKWKDTDEVGWNQVNKVPEFVYFNHSIHVNRGLNCNICHGPVQKMHLMAKGQAFQMRWCLSCHREPEKFLRQDKENPNLSPRQQVFALYDKYMAGSKLTSSEYRLLNGLPPAPSDEEIKEGKELVKERGIKVRQLQDCSICHR